MNDELKKTYMVIRYFEFDIHQNQVVKRGLTLEEAQAHCSDPESSSETCKEKDGKQRTRNYGRWFDGYSAE